MRLAPRQNRSFDTEGQVTKVVLRNDTLAAVDLSAEIEDGELRLNVLGFYIGGDAVPPQALEKRKQVLE